MSAIPAPNLQAQREAFYGRADTQHLAPLWTRLKSLVPEAPTPVGVAPHWRYQDVRPHVLGKFDDDSRKNKRIARQMQEMTDHINTVRLANIKELDAVYDRTTCVMCHRGANEPKGTMAVPQAAVLRARMARAIVRTACRFMSLLRSC